MIHYLKPHSKILYYYFLDDIVKENSLTKEYLQESILPINWTISPETKSIITSDGRIFAVGCRNTENKIDNYLYEITDTKVSKRTKIPQPKKQPGII